MKQEENYTTKESFFFDSYAFYEIIRGNKNYEKYTNTNIITTKLNIFELYHGFSKDKNEELAETSLKKYYPFAKEFGKEIVTSSSP